MSPARRNDERCVNDASHRLKGHNGVMDLPDDLTLPLQRGEPWWYWLGGRPSLDFVNTLRERWWRNVETLATPDDLVAWLRHEGLLEPGEDVCASPAQLQAARDLREAIDAAVVATIEGEPAPIRGLAAIDGWLAAAATHQTLAAGPGGLAQLRPAAPADPLEHALGLVALDAARMLGGDGRSRVRVCASDTCSARFYDRSPTAARVWCSMRGCGNAAKARRHRERARG